MNEFSQILATGGIFYGQIDVQKKFDIRKQAEA
jgi:hypothetical protein